MSSKLYCHPCSRKEVSSAADKYCTDCDEYMCKNCVTAHNSFKAFTSHRLIDSSIEPTTKLSIQKTCLKHNDMILDFFCADHDCLCCHLCMSESHRVCQKFVPLDVAAKGVKKSAMLEDVYSTLTNIRETLQKITKTSETNLKGLGDDKYNILTGFAVVKAEILKKLSEAEDELNLQITSTTEKHKSKIQTQMKSILHLANEVEETSRQIDFVSEHGSESQAGKRLEQFKVESSPCNITYTPTKMNQAQVLPAVPGVPSRTICVPMKFIFDRKFDIVSTDRVQITGIVVTDDNRLILCNTNKTELLVYSNCGDYLQHCSLEGEPWDIAVIPGEEKAVVCLSEPKKIQFINTKSVKCGSIHQVPSECYGITIVNGKICVGGNQQIYILNKQGNHETTITIPGVSLVHYLHPGPRDSVYFTAYHENTSGCVNLDGELVFTYNDDNFRGPEAVISDRGGNIYIACLYTNNIHRLTSEGECTDIILTENNGINRPYGLAFSKDYSKLFVSVDFGERISVFACS